MVVTPASESSPVPAVAATQSKYTVRSTKVGVYYPSGWAGSRVDGAFLADSFYHMVEVDENDKKKKNKKVYVPDLLAELWRDTGLVFMAVCSGGASPASPTEWTVTSQELLKVIPAGICMIIVIFCGNDILTNFKVLAFQAAWATAAERLREDMRAK